ncbi:hypothetical protein HYY71_03910 [Candidatus Woesearchaeota archaeon]|nr:hypothetical protein [Candidatus Woesearchaeota archaeon]
MNKCILLGIVLFVLLSLGVLSQINQPTTLSFNDNRICNVIAHNEVQDIYGNCVYYNNYTSCLNISGPNTFCSLNQNQRNFSCKTGEFIFIRNTTECTYPKKFTVDINNGIATKKYDIDFSGFGVCVNSTENDCLAITCGSLHGGSARNGIFNGCDGGKSCQKFLFCEEGVRVLYKASRDDFVAEDPTYKLSKLAYKEVGK